MAHQGDIMESCYSDSSFRAADEMNCSPTVLGRPVCWPGRANPFWLIGPFNEHPVTITCGSRGRGAGFLGGSPVECCFTGPRSVPGAPMESPGTPPPSLRRSSRLEWDYHKRCRMLSGEVSATWFHSDGKWFIRLLRWDVEAFYHQCFILYFSNVKLNICLVDGWICTTSTILNTTSNNFEGVHLACFKSLLESTN